MGLAKGVPAGDESHRLFVVHGHPGKRHADVAGRGLRIGLAVGALGIHVDQAHLNRREGLLQLAVARIPLVTEPLALGTPVDVVLRFPDILAAAAEAEGLKPHRFKCHVARQHHQIGPGECPAVFLLDRPEQATGLIEIGVVGPAVERGKPLRAVASTAPSVAHAIGAGAVPGHTDEKGTVVAVVGRPPGLGGRHQRGDVFFDGREVEGLKGFGVVKILIHRIALRRVLMKDLEVELVRPPIAIRVGMGGRLAGSGLASSCHFRTAAARHRADLGRLFSSVFSASDATQASENQATKSQTTQGQGCLPDGCRPRASEGHRGGHRHDHARKCQHRNSPYVWCTVVDFVHASWRSIYRPVVGVAQSIIGGLGSKKARRDSEPGFRHHSRQCRVKPESVIAVCSMSDVTRPVSSRESGRGGSKASSSTPSDSPP